MAGPREVAMQDASRQTTMAEKTSMRATTRPSERRQHAGEPYRAGWQAVGTGATTPPPWREDSMQGQRRPIRFASDAMRCMVRVDDPWRDRGSNDIDLEHVAKPLPPRFDDDRVPDAGATCPANRRRAAPRPKA
jgi:hypothetical protein